MKPNVLENTLVHVPHRNPVGAVVRTDPLLFRRAVVHALRHLHHRDELARSPLVHAPFVALHPGNVGDSYAARLRYALIAGVRELATIPNDRPAAILLENAFLCVPRRKQLVLAGELCMGFSTYRRHLSAAIDALVDVLRVAEPP